MTGVAGEIGHPLGGGITCRSHRCLLKVARRPDDLHGLAGHLGRNGPGRIDPEYPVESDGRIPQAPTE